MSFNPVSFAALKVRLMAILVFSFSMEIHSQLSTNNFTQFTEKDGLPGIQVNTLLVDKQGYVWTGTVNGLARYDGYTFKRFYYNPNDTSSLRGLDIWAMYEDSQRRIWVSSASAYLDAYNPIDQKFRQYNFIDKLPQTETTGINVKAICEDDHGRMYFGLNSNEGRPVTIPLLYKEANEEKIKIFPIPADIEMLNIWQLKKDHSGNVWIFSWSDIFIIDKEGTLSRYPYPEMGKEFDRNKDYPSDMAFDRQGHMWIITQESRLFDIDLGSGTFNTWESGIINRSDFLHYPARKIVFDKDDNVCLGTNHGLQFFDRKTKQRTMFSTGSQADLEDMVIVDLAFDSFGSLWIGTMASGLVRYDEKTLLKSYSNGNDKKTSLTAGWASNLYEASDGKIWITTGGSRETSGINILEPRTGDIKNITYSHIINGPSDITALWENSPGEIYAGIYGGVLKFSEKSLSMKAVNLSGLPENTIIRYHYNDSQGIEWLCTYTGVYKKNKGTETYTQYDLSLVGAGNSTSNLTTRVFESEKHGLWILTNNGLFLYNYTTDKIERHGYDKNAGDIFVTQDINSLHEDADGIVWVGTWSGGLSKYNVETKKIKTYTRNEGLPSMSVQGILADEKNNSLWLSTFEGLSRFDLKTEQFNNFSLADGIQGQLFADGSQLKTSGGLFLFGGADGITIFNPDDVNKNSIPPKVFLTDLKLFNKSIVPGENSILKKPVHETDEITLAYNQNNISLEFVALHFANPALNTYRYKLGNYDDDWRDVGSQRVAFYPNLPPGNYTFHVKAANDKGVWNESGATLRIVVNNPWWKTIWAFIVYGILIMASAFAVNRYLRRRLIAKEREKNRVRELEQAKEIEQAYHELKATQQQLIQSEKMASLGEMTAGIAHEIQNPLNFVNNFSEVNNELIGELKEELATGNMQLANELAENIKENGEKIVFHGKRADSIVKSMLLHSRSGTGQKELTDINAMVDEYVRLAYHGMRAKDKSFNVDFKTDLDPDLPKINVVQQDIGRVILNLINNAFQALNSAPAPKSPEGDFMNVKDSKKSTVLVKTKRILKSPSGDLGAEVIISDNGPGIPDSIKDKIFQPFFTTKPAGVGTGLGLSLSYDIIKSHGGEIKVESKEGEGTTFTIILPA